LWSPIHPAHRAGSSALRRRYLAAAVLACLEALQLCEDQIPVLVSAELLEESSALSWRPSALPVIGLLTARTGADPVGGDAWMPVTTDVFYAAIRLGKEWAARFAGSLLRRVAVVCRRGFFALALSPSAVAPGDVA